VKFDSFVDSLTAPKNFEISPFFLFCVYMRFVYVYILNVIATAPSLVHNVCYAGGGRRIYVPCHFFVNSRKLIWYAYSKRLAQLYIFSKVKVVKILLTTANPWCIQKAHWGEKSSQSKYPQNEVIKKLMRHIFFSVEMRINASCPWDQYCKWELFQLGW